MKTVEEWGAYYHTRQALRRLVDAPTKTATEVLEATNNAKAVLARHTPDDDVFEIPSRTRFAVVYREYATDWLLAGYPMLDEACEAQRIINFLKATPRFQRLELRIAKINLLPE